jgi:hypothetical protein
MLVVLRLWEFEDEDFMLTPSGGSESSMRTQAPAPGFEKCSRLRISKAASHRLYLSPAVLSVWRPRRRPA